MGNENNMPKTEADAPQLTIAEVVAKLGAMEADHDVWVMGNNQRDDSQFRAIDVYEWDGCAVIHADLTERNQQEDEDATAFAILKADLLACREQLAAQANEGGLPRVVEDTIWRETEQEVMRLRGELFDANARYTALHRATSVIQEAYRDMVKDYDQYNDGNPAVPFQTFRASLDAFMGEMDTAPIVLTATPATGKESEADRYRKALEVERDALARYVDHTHVVGQTCTRPACVAYMRITEVLSPTPKEPERES